MKQSFPFLLLFLLTAGSFALSVRAADEVSSDPGAVEQAPVDFQADQLFHDEQKQIIRATGDVILIQGGRKVAADEIVYNLQSDTALAKGNVVFADSNGDVHNADEVEFNEALKNGLVQGLQSYLTDGSRFFASSGEHDDGVSTTMYDARYTPCETCRDDPDDEPLWQIRASEVRHDKQDKRVVYKNARFEVEGVPVAYVPYFAHADGSVKRKSGFLTPSGGYTSDLGVFVEGNYYWSIAPDKDLTVGLRAMTDEAPLLLGQWRQGWSNAHLQLDGSMTYSERTDSVAGMKVIRNEEFRGYVKADGLWDINDTWRSGLEVNLTTDDQYLRQYDFETSSSDDVLKSQLFVERFDERNYTVGRLVAYQDLRIEEDRTDQPNVLPEVHAGFFGAPGSMPVLGGRWSAEGSLLGLQRESDGQDMYRVGAGLGWNRRLVSDYGLVSVFDAVLRGEFYEINDRVGSQTDVTISNNSSEARAFANFNALTSYPVAKYYEKAQLVVEPLLSLTVAPNIDLDENIPNEDSQDVQLDASNLFEANRFPGLDRVEDDTHVTYGLRTGVYDYDGNYGDIFVGQSYRFDNDENPFSVGSGLNEQESDVVGQIRGGFEDAYTLDYRFQLDNDTLASRRHEVDASANIKGVSLGSQYLFAKGLEGTDIIETREQITNSAAYYINDRWRLSGAARHDLGTDPGLRQAHVGVDYYGQCFSVSLIGLRNLTDEASGDSGTEVFVRIGLKNLGEFQSSALSFGGEDE